MVSLVVNPRPPDHHSDRTISGGSVAFCKTLDEYKGTEIECSVSGKSSSSLKLIPQESWVGRMKSLASLVEKSLVLGGRDGRPIKPTQCEGNGLDLNRPPDKNGRIH